MKYRRLLLMLWLALVAAQAFEAQQQSQSEGAPYLAIKIDQCAYDWPLLVEIEGGSAIYRLLRSSLYWHVRVSEGARCTLWSPWVALRPQVLLRWRDCRRGLIGWVDWDAWPHGRRLLPEAQEPPLRREEWELIREVSKHLGIGLFWIEMELLMPPGRKACEGWSKWVRVKDLWLRSQACSLKLDKEEVEWIEWESRP